jgi:hypothetical protein
LWTGAVPDNVEQQVTIMPLIFGRQGFLGDVKTHVDRLDTLIADIERIAIHGGPSPAELKNSPLIENWTVATMPVQCWSGR